MANSPTVPLRDGGTVDRVTVRVWEGSDAAAPVVLLAHGAGSSLRHPGHLEVCAAVAAAGPTTVSFNFAYAEAQRRSPDRMPRVLNCFRDVLDWTRAQFPGRAVVTGGRSMGGRAASLLEAAEPSVAGLVLLNYPLVGIRGGEPRTQHWPELSVPVLFVHGTRDKLLPLELFDQSRPLLSRSATTVHVIEGADHGFSVPRASGRTPADVYSEVGEATAAWLRGLA
jgi:predicted alpha/beta-hydrolase family hydrolase